ncbi:hypothetical protein [Leucobacter massiliensis]|uniref:Uncharacterized protein n=1 Tax=Leucobacter massiliensis TaxID=1686285 RepID=A0A2S9QSF6_9MICO|nr:hypothetical protein [Leucobacter massiliensis]PRI12521.1 hypothetical protein B4915_00995 [Leucobacter massiliensis]
MNTDTGFEARWPELFEPLTPQQLGQAIGACWYVLKDGFPLTKETVQRITTLLVDDPQQVAILYAPYTEAEDAKYEDLAERAERGELRSIPGTARRGPKAAEDAQGLLREAGYDPTTKD